MCTGNIEGNEGRDGDRASETKRTKLESALDEGRGPGGKKKRRDDRI